MGWQAAGLTYRLCHAAVPGCLGLALRTWWQSGHLCAWMPTSTTSCPVQAVAPDLASPSLHTGEGGGTGRSLHFAAYPFVSGPYQGLGIAFDGGSGGQSCSSTQRQVDSS